MHIWIVNPFDQLPNETDTPLRYWTICKTLADLGHTVIWWSSDFSHLNKKKRKKCHSVDGFEIKLIPTSIYKKNISFARIRNHRDFAVNFQKEASDFIQNNPNSLPDRILVSLPPLGIQKSAISIRNYINDISKSQKCKVIVDIMDAWPETLYQVIPKPLRNYLGPVLLHQLHKSAEYSYNHCDKISGVGRSYIELAQNYLHGKQSPPLHLCYHGCLIDKKFAPSPNSKITSRLKLVYIGSMGYGYDLATLIKVAIDWKKTNVFPYEIHLAGAGEQLESLKASCDKFNLIKEHRVNFHGYLRKDEIKQLLKSANLALVPNRSSSLVACPYKASDYTAFGLPIINCLEGEFKEMVNQWSIGLNYIEGNTASLKECLNQYSTSKELIVSHSTNSRKMAEKLFDKAITYPALAKFITS